MCEMTQEDALRHAGALVGQALKETEARCSVLAQYINDCERNGSRTSVWSEAVRELHALHGRRAGAAPLQTRSPARSATPRRRRGARHRRPRLDVGPSNKFRFERGGGPETAATRVIRLKHGRRPATIS